MITGTMPAYTPPGLHAWRCMHRGGPRGHSHVVAGVFRRAWQGAGVSTAQRYREFARDAHGESPTYERLGLVVAEDGWLLGRLDELPRPKRQPNLLFAATRYLGGPVEPPSAFRDWATRNWDNLAATMLARSTQTNEPARCATLLPVLAALPQPLALLEVGASAGLCLYPDAYQYRYDGHSVGRRDSPVRMDCTVSGDVPLPIRVPDVAWRAGIDLNPLDAADVDDLRWLESLLWPGQPERVARLHAAANIVKANPPLMRRGDMLAELPRLAAEAPTDATLVVFHSAVLAYLPPEARTAFIELVRSLPGRWISNEGPDVLPGLLATAPPQSVGPASFLLALDGTPLALAASHGQALHWLSQRESHALLK
jgi:Uncharacterized protein conserved in bacteria (DUF2332)